MRRREVLLATLVLILASLPAAALPSTPPGPFLPHDPIVITANAHFNATNGVVAGSGAPGDPYIIEGWAFVTAGTAIRIHNVTAAFVIRNNSMDAGVGVHITASAAAGVVWNNQFIVRGTGVLVANADVHVVDNSFLGNPALGANGVGVQLLTSNSVVQSNAFMYLRFGIHAERGSPSLVCNDIHDDVIMAGIYLRLTTNAVVDCNTITQCTLAIKVEATFGTVLTNNTIDSCFTGVQVHLNKDVTISNNTIRFTLGTQLRIETTSGNVTANVILQGRADAIVVLGSPILLANNTVHANLGVGIRLSGTGGNVSGNVVTSNSVGIVLEGGSAPTLTANVMSNNTIGIDLPYASRQAIANMSANVVNGVSIDGSINASQRVFFYKQANVTIEAQVRDSGFSAGFFGSLTAQGGIVLYEVDEADINATIVSHHTVGVGVVNSFNVNVNNSLVVSNLVGIRAEAQIGSGPVPNCVISGKDVNVTIPVDPVATIGIDLKGCLGLFANVSVSVVDVGLKVDGSAGLVLSNSTISETKVGLDVQGQPNATKITGSAFVNNRVGVRLSGTVGIFHNNTVQWNAEAGVRLENAANVSFERNNVSFNGMGVIDAEPCAGALTCSSLMARNNTFIQNRGDGARMQGWSSWRGDTALGNEGRGLALLGGAKLLAVNASGNEIDGAQLVGAFEVKDSSFTDNEDDGLDVNGQGTLDDSVFRLNEGAGIRTRSILVSAMHLNVSHNFDGIAIGDAGPGAGPPVLPPLTLPGLTGYLWSGPEGGSVFSIHRSSFYANERDAIRAGSTSVDATHNYWGSPDGPRVNIGDRIGAFQNGVTPGVQVAPWYTDDAMTTTGPVFLL